MPDNQSTTVFTCVSILCVASALFLTHKSYKDKSEIECNSKEVGSVVPQIITTPITSEEGDVKRSAASDVSGKIGHPHPDHKSMSEKYGGCIYLDYNATTPIFHEVFNEMKTYLTTCFGNPSSSHAYSAPSKEAMAQARMHIGSLINISNPLRDIYFTSCGTEADNRAIDIAIAHFKSRDQNNSIPRLPHIITCAIEHPAILAYLRLLEDKKAIGLTIVGVDAQGVVNVSEMVNSLCKSTALVTIMHSNNEVGTLQPIREISNSIKLFNKRSNSNILLHSDGAQSLGKVLIDVPTMGIDMLTIVGHKFGAPKGIAALYIREGISASECPMLVGGGQERGCRGGTENVPYIVALGEASRLALLESGDMLVHLLSLKHRLLTNLLGAFERDRDRVRLNGPIRANSPQEIAGDLKLLRVMMKSDIRSSATGVVGSSSMDSKRIINKIAMEQLPNTISISFKNVKAQDIIASLSSTVACSAGSACHAVDKTKQSSGGGCSGEVTDVISGVLLAMNVPRDFAVGTLRISFGRHSTMEEMDTAAVLIAQAVRQHSSFP
jgi:cysteine desulfurase